MRTRLLALGAVFSLVVLAWGPASGQEATSGTIEGTVLDAQGAPLPGVTVILTSDQGTKTVTTDATGSFRFAYLPAATYSVRASLQGFNTVERQNLDVRLGARVRVEITLTAGVSEQVEVIGTAPVVDISSTTTGATISSELMSSIPLGRSFSNTLALAPGVVASGIDQANPSISGASGLENAYVIDGVNINNTGYGSAGSYSINFGSLGTGVNLDYIKEVQVKTGGYEPEYGEALGGFINLVTKTGGNEFKSSGWGYFQGSGLEATRVRSDREVAAVDVTGFQTQDYGAEISGPILRDKVFFYGTFDPTFTTRTTRTSKVIAQQQGFDHELQTDRTIWNYAGNMKWFAHPKHTFTISAFGDPSTGEDGPQRLESAALVDPSRRNSSIEFGGNNATVRWVGQLLENSFIEASYSYHRDRFHETVAHNEPNITDFRSGAVQLFGSVGFIDDATSWNSQYRVKFSNFLNGAGEHNLRYGFDFQDIGYDHTANYSGTPGLPLPLSFEVGNPGATVFTPSTTGYIGDVAFDPDLGGDRLRITRIRSGPITAETKTHYTSFFLSDSWSPKKWINLMAGVRYEEETLLGTAAKFNWDNNWAPRVHLTIDPTKDNRTKVSFSYGRFFGKVPNDLAVRALSTEVTHIVRYRLVDANGNPIVDLSNPNNPVVVQPDSFVGTRATHGDSIKAPITFGLEPTVVDPNSKLTYQDEYVAGIEREVIPDLNVGVSYMHRSLGRTLEDVALVPYTELLAGADFGNYFITNPGPNILANNGQPGFPKPERKYDAVTLKWDKRLRDRWQVAGSYTWSKLEGNYEGYYRRDNGQSDPFITSLFDFPYLATPEDREIWKYTIASGPLPNDRRQVLNLFGSYAWDFKQRGAVNLGLTWRVQTGIPITALGFNAAYGNGYEIPLQARGEGGQRLTNGTVVPGDFKRGPTTHDVGLHADYSFPLGRQKVTAIVNIFNLLNYQKGLDFDQGFELNEPGDTNPDFGKATVFQSPRQVQFALRAQY
jgi:outer membrane receptor for ferrienterochelin and colicin